MDARARTIVIFTNAAGRQPYVDWIFSLKDKNGASAVQDRLDRVETGNFGDCARYGPITELRIHVGPGYRIYLGEDGPKLVILLGGSNKAKQSKGFQEANKCWQEYKGGKK